MTKIAKTQNKLHSGVLNFPTLEFFGLWFVSDFEIRISDLIPG